MSERARLLDALKRTMKARGVRYADLAPLLGVSHATVKRMLSRGPLELERLEQICAVLHTDFFELARAARRTADRPAELSLEQETALAGEPRLLMVFHLLCNDWDIAAIRREFSLDAPHAVRLLARLDRLRLVELLPGDRVRLRVPRDFAWRQRGPVRQRYAQIAVGEFVRDAFDGRDAVLNLEVRELGDASLAQLRRRLERLVAEFNECAENDATLAPHRRRSVGMLVALRPWVFSLLDSLRVEDRAGSLTRRGRSGGP